MVSHRLIICCLINIVVFCSFNLLAQEIVSDEKGNIPLFDELIEKKLYDSLLTIGNRVIPAVGSEESSIDSSVLVRVLIYQADAAERVGISSNETENFIKRAQILSNSLGSEHEHLRLMAAMMYTEHLIKTENYKKAREQFNSGVSEFYYLSDDISNSERAWSKILNGILCVKEGKYDKGSSDLKAGIQYFNYVGDSSNLKSIRAYGYLVETLLIEDRYKEAIDWSQSAISLLTRIHPSRHSMIARLHLYKGTACTVLGYSHRRIRNFEQALYHYQKEDNASQTNIAEVYNVMGNYHDDSDNYHRAIDFYQKAISIFESENDYKRLFAPKINLAIVYRNLSDWDRAFKYLEEASILFKNNYGEKHPYFLQILYIKAYILTSQEKYFESNQVINSVRQMFGKLGIDNNTLWSNLILMEAHNVNMLDFPERALKLCHNYLEFSKEHFADGYANDDQAYEILSSVYLKTLEFDSAHFYNDKIIEELLVGDQLRDISSFKQPLALIDAFSRKSKIFYRQYERNDNKNFLLQACKSGEQTFKVIKILMEHNDREETNAFLKEDNRWIFEGIIEHRSQLYFESGDAALLDLIFELFEFNKYNLLLTSYLHRQEIRYGNIEHNVLEEEQRILNTLRRLNEKQLNIQNSEEVDSIQERQLIDSLSSVRIVFDEFKKNLKQEHRKYYNQKYRLTYATLSEMQNTLANTRDCIIAYFEGDSALYSFVIDTSSVTFYKEASNPAKWSDYISSTRSTGLTEIQELNRFGDPAVFAGNSILKHVSDLSKYDHIIIIPDGKLGYVPFELFSDSLFMNELNPNGYWGLHSSIGYAYSGSLYYEQSKKKNKQKMSFAGFVADYTRHTLIDNGPIDLFKELTRSGDLHLANAKKEVREIQHIVGGQVYEGVAASRSNFIEKSTDVNIIHLAMHALLNDSLPMNSGFLFTPIDTFSNNVLTMADLFALRLDAELAVLAACQTGDGVYRKGEGISSLANAFAYAGVNSTVMSLWKVPDKATSEIMITFYKGLKSGLRKDEALQKAKLTYLSNAIELEERHPYYWAGFIVQGNMDPVVFSTNSNTLYWIIGMVLLISVFILWHLFKSTDKI